MTTNLLSSPRGALGSTTNTQGLARYRPPYWQHWVHWRFKSSKFPRQTFVEWAALTALTIPRSYWAGEFYKSQRARGTTHQAALRALAFKWARILFRCWKDGTTYDESRYLKHLKIRKSPLINGEQKHAQSA